MDTRCNRYGARGRRREKADLSELGLYRGILWVVAQIQLAKTRTDKIGTVKGSTRGWCTGPVLDYTESSQEWHIGIVYSDRGVRGGLEE